MEFYRALYFSPNIEHRGKVKRQLQKGAGSSLTLYVLTLCDLSLTGKAPQADSFTSARTGNQLQFFHSFFLKPRSNREHCPMIIGIADGRSEAVKLVQRIVEETWKTDRDYDIVRFLAKRDRRIRVPDQAEAADPELQGQSSDYKNKKEAAARISGDLT